MFEFEDWNDLAALIVLWMALCMVFPVWWWVLHSEWEISEMIHTREGLALICLNFLLSFVVSGIIRQRRQRERTGSGF